ncbi:hypothetical protein WJX73_000697 [Symbiochloris irregularis]|uniref:Serine/threonine-protein phosphatase 2A activator n=1 Tax=Symbiochloris irregularis TaxID=706552 RepID=A0AAW1PEK5_9CHLO
MPPQLPVAAGDSRRWEAASKRITSQRDLQRFLGSDALREFMAFLRALNTAVHGRLLSEAVPCSEAVTHLQAILTQLWEWVDEIPPLQQSLRYGNPAYRTWLQRVIQHAPEMMTQLLPPNLSGAQSELASYWVDSFGNSTRIDYGTGHETTFAAFLFCLARLSVVGHSDAPALVMRVFAQYLKLMRRVQTTYWLEPAGSHGVWGLDDYQFLPFLFGSSQLIGHSSLEPSSIQNDGLLKAHAPDYLYFAAVHFVRQVKKGPLAETSPMLNDISGVPSWNKVNSGMFKMYHAEVLSKFPIMQHFLFGSLLPFPDS